ncbi:MAG: hypothetical protein R3E96_17440 [Planctomycetota bacterium]
MMSLTIRRLLAPLATSLFLGPVAAFAQGPDCGSAQAIAGFGVFPYDTTAGAAGGIAFAGCSITSMGTAYEGWFEWTATQAGPVRFEVDNIAGDRRVLLMTPGACPAACLEGTLYENTGGSAVAFTGLMDAQVGDMVRVVIFNSTGLAVSGVGGPGDLRILQALPCTQLGASTDALEDNDDCSQAVALGPGVYSGLSVQPGDDDYYSVTIPPLTELVVWPNGGSSGSIEVQYRGTDCSAPPTTPFGAPIQNFTLDPVEHFFRIHTSDAVHCGTYDLQVTFANVYCTTANTSDDEFEPNDTLAQAAVALPGMHAGLFVAVGDSDSTGSMCHRATCSKLVSASYLQLHFTGCSRSPLNDVRNQRLVNRTDQPYPVYIEVGSSTCADYDAVFDVTPLTCSHTVYDLGGRLTYPLLLEGFYPWIDPFDVEDFVVEVPLGQRVELDILLPAGVTGEIRCCESWFDCFLSGNYIMDSGNAMHVEWTNPNTSPMDTRLTCGLSVDWPGGVYDPCIGATILVRGSGGTLAAPEIGYFCNQATPNSTGSPVDLFAWVDVGSLANLQAEATQGPPGQFGILVGGSGQNVTGVVVGSGVLCLDPTVGPLGRYNIGPGPLQSLGYFDPHGVWRNLSGNSAASSGYAIPATTPWGSTLAAGSTLYLQLWYRDVGGTSNLSNGVSLTF